MTAVPGVALAVYSADDKEEILDLVMRVGMNEAYKRTGVAIKTLKRWANDADLAVRRTETTRRLSEALAYRRMLAADDLMGDLQRIREQLFEKGKIGNWHQGEYTEAEVERLPVADQLRMVQAMDTLIDGVAKLMGGKTGDPSTVQAVQVNIHLDQSA